MTKICSKCNQPKDLTHFYKWKTVCKECVSSSLRQNYEQKQIELGLRITPPLRKRGSVTPEQKHQQMIAGSRRYAQRHPDKKRANARQWAIRNRDKNISYWKNQYQTNPIFNLATKLRRRIHNAISYAQKTEKTDQTINLLGCSFNKLKGHIELQFTKDMAWDDILAGKIHLDHIKPVSSFNLTDPKEQKACFHYTNLQPLWASDNLRKSDKVIWQQA